MNLHTSKELLHDAILATAEYLDMRDTMHVEKAYLQGRFDVIPFIYDSSENLKSIVNG